MTESKHISVTPSVLRACVVAIFCATIVVIGSGCASSVMKAENAQEMLKNDEFEKSISVSEIGESGSGTYVRLPGPAPIEVGPPPIPLADQPAPPVVHGRKGRRGHSNKSVGEAETTLVDGGKNLNKPLVGRQSVKNPNLNATVSTVVASPNATVTLGGPREPKFEDSEGFAGRRPEKDPFRVGEKVTLDVSYFNVSAGDFTVETRPFVVVNGRKSYHFAGTASSTSVFAMFYAVDDWFETFVDFDTLVPYSYSLHVKESKQLRETRTLFDWKKSRAFFWDKKINSDKNLEEKKNDWDIPAYAQNIFSSVYYLRNFKLTPGKKIVFNVAHEKENLQVTAEVLRREKITTPAGEFDTVVVKPKIELNGYFKPVGDIFIWLTDDDRKFVVRIESKIKIGTIVAVSKAIERGD